MERAKPLCLACCNAECAAGSLNWSIFSISTVLIFVSKVKFFLIRDKPSGLPLMSTTAQSNSRGRYSHPGPPWYSRPLIARSGPEPLGGYCYSSHNGRQTGENPCGLTLAFRPLIGVELSAYFGGRLPVLMAGDLKVKHVDLNGSERKTGKLLRDYAHENSCLIFGPHTPTTNP